MEKHNEIGLVFTALVMAVTPSIAQTRSDTTKPTNSLGASEYAPGQEKSKGQSASDYAPGKMEKGGKGASTNAPGRKMQNSETPSGSSGSSTGTGNKH